MVNSKHAFWQALVFTIIIFLLGVSMGFLLENSRSKSIELSLRESEINLLDEQIRSRGINQFEVDCTLAKKSTFNFANNIYAEALQLEEFDDSAKFTETLKILHKRYDLLRVLLWMEGIEIKENCEQKIHTLVYIFEYDAEKIEQKAIQVSYSRLLLDMKNAHEDEILLIPIAGNLDIESVNLILEKYKIKKLPVIIVDEKIIIENQITFQELEKIIFQGEAQSNQNKIILNPM